MTEQIYSSPPAIDEDHLPTCKMGQGPDCCRYLVMAARFSCAKRTSLRTTLDSRVEAGAMTARGDNCPGWPPERGEGDV